MHEKHTSPSQPSAFAVHSPIFPGEYSQFWPSLVHAPAGLCGVPSGDVPVAGHAARQRATIAHPTVVRLTGT